MDAMLLDLRVILRGWRRSPAVVLLAIVVLGLGVGVLTGMLTLLQRVVVDRLPVRAPEELVKLVVDRGEDGVNQNLSLPMLEALRAGGPARFAGVVGHANLPLALDAGGGAERVTGAALSSDAFGMLGVSMRLGNDLSAAGERGVVLSHALWQRRFAGERAALGREVRLNGHRFVVAGVAPEPFRGLSTGVSEELWVGLPAYTTLVPDAVRWADRPRTSWISVFARWPSELAAEEMLAPRLAAWSEALRREGLLVPAETLSTLQGSRGLTWMVDELARPLLVLNLLAVLLLLLVAANFAGLVTARAVGRRGELAVRASLGAPGGRLLGLLLLEALLMAASGALLAVPVALATVRGLLTFPSPMGEPLSMAVVPDARLLALAFGLSLFAGLAVTALPAWRVVRTPLAPALRGVAAGAVGMPRGRGALVVAQTALALTLLCAAALFGRTLQRLAAIDPGYESDGVLLARIEATGYEADRAAALWERLLTRVEAIPGVHAATVATTVPPSAAGMRWGGFTVEGSTPAAEQGSEADVVIASPGWFATLRLPVLVGRAFDARDVAGAPEVAVVNETFVRRYVQGRDARGAHILDGPAGDPQTKRIEIVGVVPDGPVRDLRAPVPPVIYRSLGQERSQYGLLHVSLLVRAGGDPADVASALRRELAALDPGVPLFGIQPLTEHVAAASGRERMVALLGALFGLLALLVAALGLYALLTWYVLQQRREMAVRTVLGAARSQVRRMVLRRGMRLVAFGAALGVAGALALGRAVRGTLYGVGPGDPLALLLGASTLVLAALIACWAPARRAARVEPMTALKEP